MSRLGGWVERDAPDEGATEKGVAEKSNPLGTQHHRKRHIRV